MQISRVMNIPLGQFVTDSGLKRFLVEQECRRRNTHGYKVTRAQPRRVNLRQSKAEFIMLPARKVGVYERYMEGVRTD
jgi:hypothetical protein